jgi:hypothetical protein
MLRIYSIAFVFLFLLLLATSGFASDESSVAEQVLSVSKLQGGLIVHLGCGDGRLTEELGKDDRFLVHGLDVDEDNIATARDYLSDLGVYGQVSVSVFDGKRLPYADNLVNLIVAESPIDVSEEELLRVLAPFGMAMIKTGGQWRKIVKPRPDEMDEWTHFLHAADGNAVSSDRQVGRPESLRWLDDPAFSRHHDEVLALSAMVTGGGRIFSIVDEAPRATFHSTIGGNFFLIARDAFNGLVLWKKPIEDWGWHSWGEQQKMGVRPA